MDERMKNIAENFESLQIGLDNTFRFHCTQCGKCCIHREDILLNPKDVYNMSKELGISPEVLIERYGEIYVGPDSRVPIVRLKPRGSVRRCPLLKDRKCMVHPAKPTICAMFPLGRCLVMENPREDTKSSAWDCVRYIYSNPGCGDRSETHTVREWLERFGIPLEDEFFLNWQGMVVEMTSIFREVEDRMSEETMGLVWTTALSVLYLHYDMGQEFAPQFDENARNFRKLLHEAFPYAKHLRGQRGGEKNERK